MDLFCSSGDFSNDQNKIKPVVTPTDLMSLENFEACLKLPGNLPVTKITFEVPSMKLICPVFVPIADDTPPEEAGEIGHITTGHCPGIKRR